MKKFKALLLAGERSLDDPLLRATKAPSKALVPVGGVPMVERVIGVLLSCPHLEKVLLVGPRPEIWEKYLAPRLKDPRLSWAPPASSPSLSAYKGLEILGEGPILLTTSDHVLLTSEMIVYLLHRAEVSEKDLAVGVARYEMVKAAYPEAQRTVYRLKEGAFCSTNLYVFLTPTSKKAVLFWRQIETKRKKPLQIVKAFGLIPLVKYLTKRLSLNEAFEHVSKVLGCQVEPVILPFPEAAIDVDDLEDLALANKILAKRGEREL